MGRRRNEVVREGGGDGSSDGDQRLCVRVRGSCSSPRQQPATTSVKPTAVPLSPPPASGPNLLEVVILKNG